MTLSSVFTYSAALTALLFFCGCRQTPETDKATVTETTEATTQPATAITYQADPNQSKLTWIGANVTGNHNGTIALREGSLSVAAGQITGGRFVFEMATLKAEDLELPDAQNKKLTGHLMSPDFFNVVRHPTAEMEITKVTSLNGTSAPADADNQTRARIVKQKQSQQIANPTHTVTGNLTLKGITKSITFPARITITDNTVTAQANFLINRTDWKLNYMSEKSLADKMIYPEVNIGLDIVANR